ncbi:MAG: hypothetical protein QM791_06370 [Ferruginibacter sp.]
MKKIKQILEATVLVAALPALVYAELNRKASNIPSIAEQYKTEAEKTAGTALHKNNNTAPMFSLLQTDKYHF